MPVHDLPYKITNVGRPLLCCKVTCLLDTLDSTLRFVDSYGLNIKTSFFSFFTGAQKCTCSLHIVDSVSKTLRNNDFFKRRKLYKYHKPQLLYYVHYTTCRIKQFHISYTLLLQLYAAIIAAVGTKEHVLIQTCVRVKTVTREHTVPVVSVLY